MLMVLLAQSGLLVGSTEASWNDSETISDHSITTGYWVKPTAELTAEPEKIGQGASSTLRWNSDHTASCEGDNFDTKRDLYGSKSVTPNETSIYTLTCQGLKEGSEITATTTVTVDDPGNDQPPVNDQPPNDEPKIEKGDVIINELFWAGSSAHSRDQWIELRNMTDQEISIGQWEIKNGSSGGGKINIPANHTIPAEGFYLIANYNKNSNNSALAVEVDHNPNVNLNNDYSGNGQVILKDTEKNTIDHTPVPDGSEWPEGVNDGDNERSSMQRSQDPGNGTDPGNWYTCDRDVLKDDETLNDMKNYWKEDHRDINCGTPGHPNLSGNDPNIDNNIDNNADQEPENSATSDSSRDSGSSKPVNSTSTTDDANNSPGDEQDETASSTDQDASGGSTKNPQETEEHRKDNGNATSTNDQTTSNSTNSLPQDPDCESTENGNLSEPTSEMLGREEEVNNREEKKGSNESIRSATSTNSTTTSQKSSSQDNKEEPASDDHNSEDENEQASRDPKNSEKEETRSDDNEEEQDSEEQEESGEQEEEKNNSDSGSKE